MHLLVFSVSLTVLSLLSKTIRTNKFRESYDNTKVELANKKKRKKRKIFKRKSIAGSWLWYLFFETFVSSHWCCSHFWVSTMNNSFNIYSSLVNGRWNKWSRCEYPSHYNDSNPYNIWCFTNSICSLMLSVLLYAMYDLARSFTHNE